MRKCVKGHQCRNLLISYVVDCLLATAFVLCTSLNNCDSDGFVFGLYLFTFCQVFIWGPLSICMVLIVYKMKILLDILNSFRLCLIYTIAPLFLMTADSLCDNVWIGLFNVDSLFGLFLVNLSYYIAVVLIAVMHKVMNRWGGSSNHPDGKIQNLKKLS